MINKLKCPVFGCTIPRGIPHEHPAGVSAVMRDPGAPLTDIERAELQYHRHQASVRNQIEFNKMATAAMAISEVEQQMCDSGVHVIRDAPMVPGRMLRDALMMAGKTIEKSDSDLSFYDESNVKWDEPEPRLSVVQIAGRIATGIVLATGVALILILSAMTAGWL